MKHLLSQLVTSQPLSLEQSIEAFELIMTGQASPAQIAALLALIQQRGPAVPELVGAATVMRQKVTPVTIPQGLSILDTCGTGGDHAQTFNISTAAALVAAAVGRPRNVAVAKHGNRSVTSQSGSSQVLEALGVRLQVSSATLTRCLDEVGLCFCFAPAHHPAMKHALPVRMELGFRTIFNLLGPLTNPAGAHCQVVGVYHPDLTETVGQVLRDLGIRRAMVIHGNFGQGGLDELSTAGPNQITHVQDRQIATEDLDASALGLVQIQPAALRVDSPAASAKVIRSVLANQPGPARDIVCLNAAAALMVADLAGDWREGIDQATQALASGAAASVLDQLVALTQSEPVPAT